MEGEFALPFACGDEVVAAAAALGGGLLVVVLEFGVVGFGVADHEEVGGLGGLADEGLGDKGLQGGEADEEVGHGVVGLKCGYEWVEAA